ncbi:hypothetical protein NDU88_004697 [Pleurodeles waltl]|uniref:Uncharacterized protein n=1 Tax=Pleurodeles waltl TaxID=8319 RepID=A0AAV7WB43_PLEWA|nr:hypothetical protein NDU88_004697 [Pleurodeles waltl]
MSGTVFTSAAHVVSESSAGAISIKALVLAAQGGGQWRSVPYREDSTSIAAPGSARCQCEKGGCGEQSLVQRRLLLPGAPRRVLKSVVPSNRGLQVRCPLAGGAAGIAALERADLASALRPEVRRTGSQAISR